MTSVFDLEDELADRRERLETVESTQADLLETVNAEYDSFEEVPKKIRDKFDKLEDGRVELEGEIEALADLVDEHEDTQFRLRQLTGGELAQIKDEVNQESFEFDARSGDAEGVPKSGYGEVLWVRRAVEKAPDWVEDSQHRENDPANLPWQVFEMLSDAVNAFNTVGDTTLGNSSLRERMESTSSSPKPSTED